ncbi:hypothetical protein R6Z07F_003646 [Ovis aries]
MPSGKARLSTVCPVGLAPVLRSPLAISQGSREFLEAVSVILRTEVTSRVKSAFTMRETQMRRHGPPPHTRSSDGPWDTALQAAGVRMRGVSSTRGKREARWSRSRTVPRLRPQSMRRKVQEGKRPSEAANPRGVETPTTSPWPPDRPAAAAPRRDPPSWAKLAWAVSLLLLLEAGVERGCGTVCLVETSASWPGCRAQCQAPAGAVGFWPLVLPGCRPGSTVATLGPLRMSGVDPNPLAGPFLLRVP